MTTTQNQSLLGDVSDRDRRRWQAAAARALSEILKRADKQKLKPIAWTLGGGLQLVGTLNSTDYGNVEKTVGDAFARWADLLCLTCEDPVQKSGGGIYLIGRHDNWRPSPKVTGARVTIIAQTFTI